MSFPTPPTGYKWFSIDNIKDWSNDTLLSIPTVPSGLMNVSPDTFVTNNSSAPYEAQKYTCPTTGADILCLILPENATGNATLDSSAGNYSEPVLIFVDEGGVVRPERCS